MKKTIFTGAATALITPFNDKGVDFDSLGRLIDFQVDEGIDALVVCGTTGEAPTLEDGEHLDVIEYAVDRVKGKIPIIAGTGSNNTAHAIMMNKEAEKRGADALLWVTPYYNKTTQQGLINHYSLLASSTNLPAILYNVPSRTGVDIKAETVERLAETDNIVAIKEASGSAERVVDIMYRCGDKIDVYSGNDDIIVPLMSMGAKGVISVLSNVVPAETAKLCHLCLEGDFKEAADMQLMYSGLIKALFCEVNPIPVKTALSLMGMDSGILRPPLYQMSDDNLRRLENEMKKISLK